MNVELFAWIGEDEHGNGEVGLKQALCPAGMIPLVAVRMEKAAQEYIREQMQAQVNQYGKTICLVRFTAMEEIIRIEPQ